MAAAASTLVSPVGGLLSDLPFVNKSDGYRLHNHLGAIFESPIDQPKTFMLHFVTQKRPGTVLLEMVADVFISETDESIIVLTGREVADSGLAGLIACDAVSESNHDVNEDDRLSVANSFPELPSVSQAGSAKRCGDANAFGRPPTGVHRIRAAGLSANRGDNADVDGDDRSMTTFGNVTNPKSSPDA